MSTGRYDLDRANDHLARRIAGDGGYGSVWQWLRSRLPRLDWTW